MRWFVGSDVFVMLPAWTYARCEVYETAIINCADSITGLNRLQGYFYSKVTGQS